MDDKADKTKETKRPSSMQQETNISRESGEALELKRSRLCDLWQDGTISDIEKGEEWIEDSRGTAHGADSRILDSHLQFLETEAGSSAFDALVNLELENQGR
ncbi:hypothetical protein OOU_Y34scaffold00174g18 [Pyricularia oryzae Y34]|uniref:Uncharacterized protein n=1 Tax=Pyricularia oryzae (strain Y34) TaxID=1143189 RepID=A0AA97P6Q3_PYRO3|nr:hypothetical protein OOU_Y34scaffold00174g18 [Pyricularia oryzae Y34]